MTSVPAFYSQSYCDQKGQYIIEALHFNYVFVMYKKHFLK